MQGRVLMILRIVRGHVAADRLDALTEGFVDRYAPLARDTPGLVRFHAAVRPDADGHELVVVTFWSSVEAALKAYGGDMASVRTLDGLARDADLTAVEYFEIDETQFRRSTADAAVLRLTFGQVAKGIDAEIQQELRSRLHELEPAMTEAYVGRRMLGQDVQIAFVSAWETVSTRLPLDEPFWPEISGRYERFVVATYRPIVSGAESGSAAPATLASAVTGGGGRPPG
jgi:hypothetical protein